MAYDSAHTGPEIDAAVQMLSQVQVARDSTKDDLAEVKSLAAKVDSNTSQVQAQTDTVVTKAEQVSASAQVIEQARIEVVAASANAEEAKNAASEAAGKAISSGQSAAASQQAAAKSQVAAGLSEQVTAENAASAEASLAQVKANAERAAVSAKTAADLVDGYGYKHYPTYMKMVADAQAGKGIVGIVDDDPDKNLNGWYSWNDTQKKWVRLADQPAVRSVVDYRVPELVSQGPRMVPLILSGKKVLLWAEDGKIDGVGMQETVVAAARKLLPEVVNLRTCIPLVVNGQGKVIAWLRDGKFEASGLTPVERVVPLVTNTSTSLVPLIFTEGGKVIAWLREGKFDAAGLKETTALAVQEGIDAQAKKNPPKVTDGSTLYAYRSKIAKALGGSGSARVVFTGDSWTEHLSETAQPLAQALYTAYGQAGTGWVGMDADEGGATSTKSQLLNGARLVKSGFALLDMSATECNSLDGHAAAATGTAATIKITNLKTQSLTWYYKDGDGTFRYSIDGAEPVVVAGGNTGARKALEISGLSDTAHSITFDLVGNTGTVTMYGGMALRSAPGVEFSKAGNGGSTAVQWQGIAPFVQSYAAELKPDLAIIILGTNDLNQGITKAAFKAGIQALVAAYKTGSPNCAVILVTPTRGYSTSDLGLMAAYAEAMTEVAQSTTNVEFLNLNAFMPPRLVTNDLGLWADAAHLSENGGRFVTGLLMKYFLLTN
ncbi:MAG: hypothetical protein K0S85_2889 [Pseudomonas orientalis]|jgi:lysophospholipase L1-like esterase|nr:hypothetical protein [Pseudomonas orientalis]